MKLDFEMRMPKLTETMTDVKLLSWLVKEGEKVKEGQVICEVETDKVTVTIDSLRPGIVKKILFKEGEEVPANAVIAIIAQE